MSKVAIIIVTWNGMKWIEKCLNSIRHSTYPVTVYVVDNKSTDKTPDFIERTFSEVKLTRSDKNLGFGKANNLAILQAYNEGNEYFFLLNQDAYIQPNTVAELLKVTSSNNDYYIVSPTHLNGDASDVDPYFRDFVLAKCPLYLRNSILNSGQTLFESDFIPAAAWFLPRRTIETIGGFDPLFYHYGEDDNYCQRCIYHQHKIVFTTDAYVLHDRLSTVGNKDMYNHKLFFRHLIQDSANILYTKGFIIQKLGRQFYDETGLFFMYLLTGKWKSIHNFIKDYMKLLFSINKVIKSRRNNKQIHGLTI